ncbi:MAG: MFS transporter, partial [Methanococcaceae archaeon]
VVLSYVGDMYSSLSGTAFSIVIVIALLGNTSLNYLVGIIAQSFGIKNFPPVLIISSLMMASLLWIVTGKVKDKIKI